MPAAAAGTIRREFQVLTRLLNLAVRYDKLNKNRLTKVDLPEAAKRTRVAEPDELQRIRTATGQGVHEDAMVEIWRAVIVALNTAAYVRASFYRSNGHGFTKNRTDIGLYFLRPNARAFKKYWDGVCARAKMVDLRFHDLRHTFATRLQRLGVDYEVRQALIGHKMPGMTANYSHGGPE